MITPYFGTSYSLLLASTMLIIFAASGKSSLQSLARGIPKGSVAGALFFLEVVCNNMALASTQAVYMISVKRLSILMGVIYGGFLFRERHLPYGLAGALMMAGGAVVISVWG